MMKKALLFALFLTLGIVAEAQLLYDPGDRSTATNIVVQSDEVLLLRRRLYPVFKDENNRILNDGGTIGEKICTDAIDQVANETVQMTEAAHTAMTNSLTYLNSALENAARDSIGIAIAFAPEDDTDTLTLYVADEYTDGTNDTFCIWFNSDILLPLNVFMDYGYYGGTQRVKLSWHPNFSFTTNVTDNCGRLWENCRVARCVRPDFAKGVTCITEPNIPFGGTSGFNFGGAILVNELGEPFLTCEVTNTIDKLVMRFNNGIPMEIFSYDTTPEPEE